MTDVCDLQHIFDEVRLQHDLKLQRFTNALDTYLQTYFERYQQQQLQSTSEWCPIDTNHLTDDEESWVFTYLIAYTVRYLQFDQKPLKDYCEYEIRTAREFMQQHFGIDFTPSISDNDRFVRFDFRRVK